MQLEDQHVQSSTLEGLDHKVSSRGLDVRVGRIKEVLIGNTEARLNIADSVSENTKVKRLGDPVRRNTLGDGSHKAVCLGGRIATLIVNIASQVGPVLGVPEEDNTFDGIECRSSNLRKCITSCSRTLGIAFKDKAGSWVLSKLGVDLGNDVSRAYGRDLGEIGRIDSVVF